LKKKLWLVPLIIALALTFLIAAGPSSTLQVMRWYWKHADSQIFISNYFTTTASTASHNSILPHFLCPEANNTEWDATTTATIDATTDAVGQTFLVGAEDISVCGISLVLKPATSYDGSLTVQIWNLDSQVYNSDPNSASKVSGATVTVANATIEGRIAENSETGWFYFEFAAPVTLDAATWYGITVVDPTISAGSIKIMGITEDNYGGVLSNSADSGATFTEDVNDYDLGFILWENKACWLEEIKFDFGLSAVDDMVGVKLTDTDGELASVSLIEQFTIRVVNSGYGGQPVFDWGLYPQYVGAGERLVIEYFDTDATNESYGIVCKFAYLE